MALSVGGKLHVYCLFIHCDHTLLVYAVGLGFSAAGPPPTQMRRARERLLEQADVIARSQVTLNMYFKI